MVLENFKSYAGKIELGPFNSVSFIIPFIYRSHVYYRVEFFGGHRSEWLRKEQRN